MALKAVERQAIADHLSKNPIDDCKDVNHFSDEIITNIDAEKEYPCWRMYFNGTINILKVV